MTTGCGVDPYPLRVIFVVGPAGSEYAKVASDMFLCSGLKRMTLGPDTDRFLHVAKTPSREHRENTAMPQGARELRAFDPDVYAARRYGLVVEAKGWEYAKMAEAVQRFRNLGYDTHLVFVTAELDTARLRSDADEAFTDGTWYDTHGHMERMESLFGPDRFHTVDTSRRTTPTEWQRDVVPLLTGLAGRILRRALDNEHGQVWLQSSRRTACEPAPREPARSRRKPAAAGRTVNVNPWTRPVLLSPEQLRVVATAGGLVSYVPRSDRAHLVVAPTVGSAEKLWQTLLDVAAHARRDAFTLSGAVREAWRSTLGRMLDEGDLVLERGAYRLAGVAKT